MRIKVFCCVILVLIVVIADRNFHMITPPFVEGLYPFTDTRTVKLTLYKTKDSGITIIGNDDGPIDISPWKYHFNPRAETKMITHGWTSSSDGPEVQLIKNEYLTKGKYNVIALDWSNFSKMEYLEAVREIRFIAKIVVKIIKKLIDKIIENSKKFHLIGFSLGAHLMGFVGAFSQNPIGRITGLDPAGPMFDSENPSERLGAEDAAFVDVIHTCAHVLGIGTPIGHADFYPNGGIATQPGCWKLGNPIACSHQRAYEFFAESINHPNAFSAMFCGSWEALKVKSCKSDSVVMGDATSTSTRGVFYLETNSKSPFAKGSH